MAVNNDDYLGNIASDLMHGRKVVVVHFLYKHLLNYAEREFWRVESDRSIEIEDTIQDALVEIITSIERLNLNNNKAILNYAYLVLKRNNIDIYRRKNKNVTEQDGDAEQKSQTDETEYNEDDGIRFDTTDKKELSNSDCDVYFNTTNFLQRQEDLERFNQLMFSKEFDLYKEVSFRLMDWGDYSRKEILDELELTTEIQMDVIESKNSDETKSEMEECKKVHFPVTVEDISHWASQVRKKLNIHNTDYKKGDERNKR